MSDSFAYLTMTWNILANSQNPRLELNCNNYDFENCCTIVRNFSLRFWHHGPNFECIVNGRQPLDTLFERWETFCAGKFLLRKQEVLASPWFMIQDRKYLFFGAAIFDTLDTLFERWETFCAEISSSPWFMIQDIRISFFGTAAYWHIDILFEEWETFPAGEFLLKIPV